jgi:hypothetical protein
MPKPQGVSSVEDARATLALCRRVRRGARLVRRAWRSRRIAARTVFSPVGQVPPRVRAQCLARSYAKW